MIIFSEKTSMRAQSLDNLDVIIYEDSIRSVHLTGVSMDNCHTYFDTKGRTEINFSYNSYWSLKNIEKLEPEVVDDITIIPIKFGSANRGRTNVRFLPTNTKGVYKVETMYFPSKGSGRWTE